MFFTPRLRATPVVAPLLSGLLLLALCFASPDARAQQADPAALTVHLNRTGPKVSPLLYGIFFEEINHAGDGGLYAELVRNRSFEDSAQAPEGWSPIALGDASATLALDAANPLNNHNPHALRLDITPRGTGAGTLVGVANEGYWGVALRGGEPYRLSFFARGDARLAGKGAAPLVVRLQGADGTVYAGKQVTGLSTAWKRHTVTLTPSTTDPKARLVLLADGGRAGTLYLDVVSLFPERTFKNRPNGMRPDLAQMVADLKPAFLRFPGGCFVEGDRLADAYRWKLTLGDIATRPGRPNLWGYRSTDGLGFHEYLQLCEDMGAAPLLVVNCGMSHKENEPLANMKVWIQDALDALEYANGPATSKWGGLRARNGHPKPFNIKLLEIGNENGGPAYNERYALLYDAVRARYPDVKIVANDWGGRPTSRPFDLVDEHYYNSPDWFLANANRYDAYSRTGPKVYVGEYAVTSSDVGLGNLRGALAEAAFMMGMERNSDVVAMASYAPLFVNVNDRKWNPDAIGFDSSRAFATPSYHVQKLFSLNRPDVIIPVTLTGGGGQPKPAQAGQIGLGTWRTQAEFADIRVTAPDGRPFDPTAGVRVVSGDWSEENGVVRQTSEAENVRAVGGPADRSDYTITLRARKTAGAEGFLVLFRAKDDRNYYWWNVGGWNNNRHAVERVLNGAKSIVSAEAPGHIETGRWYDLKIEAAGSRIRCYLDNKLVHDFEERAPQTLHAVAGRSGRDLIVKIVNAGDAPRTTSVSLDGGATLAASGTVTVLTADAPDAENSLDAPTKVAPKTETLNGVGPRFSRTFPPHSLTILRLKTR